METAEALGATFYELHYIKNIRWVPNEISAFINIYKLYGSIEQNMLFLSENNDFDDTV